jgi:DNA-directed RNA polymerase specialized sigma subunit
MNYIYETEAFMRNLNDYEQANTNLLTRLSEINTQLEGYKSQQISDMPHGGSGAEPDDKICNLIFEKDRVTELLKKNQKKLNAAQKALTNMDDNQRKMLKMSFDDSFNEEDILSTFNISRRTYYRMKNNAIRKIGRQLWGISVDGY